MTPGLRFFLPKPSFLAWAKRRLRPPLVYDVGAGDGHVAKALEAIGFRVLALDLYPHADAEVLILERDGTTYPYLRESVVMLCRPCHGYFPLGVVEQALAQEVQTLVYVGKRDNIELDLGDYAKHFRVELESAGNDKEVVLMWRKNEGENPERNKVALVRYPLHRDAYWVLDRAGHWETSGGGWCPKSKDDVVLEVAEIDEYDFQQLDWTKTGYYKTEGDHGWLSPEGQMYYCDYAEHDAVAYYILKRPSQALVEEGWVRVNGPGRPKEYTFSCPEKDPTPAQLEWLKAHGHDLNPYGLQEPNATPEEAKQRREEEDQKAFARYVAEGERRTGRKLKTPNE